MCGPPKIAGQAGPWDYRVKDSNIPLVETYHFTPKVELLFSGQSTHYIAGDISYTLIRIPNHHRALVALTKYGERVKSDQPQYAEFTIECFYRRAIRFAPDDTVVRLLFADYLRSKNRDDEAAYEVDRAVAMADDNAFTHYNAGLMYFDLKKYEQALKQAHVAAQRGFVRSGLRDKLAAVGQWREPPVAGWSQSAASGAAPAAAASAASAR